MKFDFLKFATVILVLNSVIISEREYVLAEEQKNILCLMSMTSPSHHIWNRSIMEALALQGHNITALSIQIDPNPPKNLHYIELEGLYEALYSKEGAEFDLLDFSSKSIIGITSETIKYFTTICKSSLSSKGLQKLMNYPDSFKFDLVIFDYTPLPCLHGLVHKFNNPPTIGVTAFGLPPHTSDLTGSPNFPSLIPYYTTSFSSTSMSFWEKSLNVFYYVVEWAQRRYSIWLVDAEVKKTFGESLPYIGEMEEKTDLVLVNNHPSMDVPQVILPTVKQVGGLQISDPKELPEDIKKFIETSKKGAVLFSLGTNMKSEIIGEEKINMFMNAIERIPNYNFIWKIEMENMTFPKNVMVTKWIPQNDVLAHPKIKLFLTHGGLLSTQEATWHGVPMLGMPFFVDQHANVQKSIDAGVAERLNFHSLTEEEILEKLRLMLDNSSYQSAMSLRSSRFRDRVVPPLQEAVWWCEYVMRHKGAPHLRSLAATMSTYTLFMWDLLIVWGVILISILALTRLVFKKIFSNKYCCESNLEVIRKKQN